MKRIPMLLVLLFICSSHELFLKTDSYFLSEGEAVELYLYNGTFDQSENVISRDRIVSANILGPDYNFNPSDADYFDQDASTRLKFATGKEGTYLAGISTKARNIELTAVEFKEYLEHEGLDRMVKEREGKGISDKDVVEKYSKHVKALLQVGNSTSEEYKTVLDYPIEFIPQQNPYELTTGENIDFQLVYKGNPLSNTVVRFGLTESGSQDVKSYASITDDDGLFSFELGNPGQYYVATIHMVESDEPGLDYESNWATLTFAVK